MQKMLFNASHPEELRVCVVDDNKLCDLIIEQTSREQKKANIYKGRISRIEPSLEAAFVDYGQERHGFLPLKEIASEYFKKNVNIDSDGTRPNIKDLLKEGQELLVQVDKEERGSKGAALSSYISLAGSYLVLMPNNPKAGGISRRVESEERANLREILDNLQIPEGMGVIIRTAGVGKSLEELQWDLDYLLKLWQEIKRASSERPSPFLVHQESDASTRALRDYLREDISEIVIDDETLYEKIKSQIAWLHPGFVDSVKHYSDQTPLFSHYRIENQIEAVFRREVRLPSGGSLVIDRAEALVAIDINSAQATKGGDIEETAFNTNLEAADEIAKQLRLRDLGGLIVIDFIDMYSNAHQRDVESRLIKALSTDRARIQVGRISRFGLLEMSRQRLRPSLSEATQEICPRCHGRGTIRSIESLSVSILRLIEDAAAKDNTGQVHAQVPVDVATFLLNEKRENIATLEKRLGVLVFIIPNSSMKTPEFSIERVRSARKKSSYEMVDEKSRTEKFVSSTVDTATRDVPAVKGVSPTTPAPKASPRRKPAKKSLLSRIIEGLFGKPAAPAKKHKGGSRRHSNQQRRRRTDGRRDQSRGGKHQKRHSSQQRRGSDRRSQDSRGNQQRTRSSNKDRKGSGGRGGHPATRSRSRNDRQRSNRDRDQGERRQSSDRQQRQQRPRQDTGSKERNKPAETRAASRRPVQQAPVEKPKAAAPVVEAKVNTTTTAPAAPVSKPVDSGGFKQVETSASTSSASTQPSVKKKAEYVRPQVKHAGGDEQSLRMVETDSAKDKS